MASAPAEVRPAMKAAAIIWLLGFASRPTATFRHTDPSLVPRESALEGVMSSVRDTAPPLPSMDS